MKAVVNITNVYGKEATCIKLVPENENDIKILKELWQKGMVASQGFPTFVSTLYAYKMDKS